MNVYFSLVVVNGKKVAMACTLDMDLLKELEAHVEALTHSGKPALDAEVMKKVKKICR